MSDTEQYAEHGCPGASDGIHEWEKNEDTGIVTCTLCGAKQ